MSRSEVNAEGVAHAKRAPSNPILAFWRVSWLLVGSVVLLAVWVVVKSTASSTEHLYEMAARWTGYWARYCCWAAGFRVRVAGTLPPNGVLIAPNHVSYGDVLAIGSLLPCFFVAKVDVESWPLIGTLFKLSHSIGVPRTRAKALVEATTQIQARLATGQSVCVFLEGTSSGGNRLLPFYPPLVQPAIDARAAICPVALRWSAQDPRVDVAEDIAYWREEHTFGPHAWRLLGMRGIAVDIAFGDRIDSAGHTRKTLAADAHAAVARMLNLGADAVSLDQK